MSDKISIWHKIMNASVKAAFPVDIFRTHFATGVCSIRGFGKAWFTEFDAGVCRLLATPVFNFSMSQADHEIALRYLVSWTGRAVFAGRFGTPFQRHCCCRSAAPLPGQASNKLGSSGPKP